MKREKLAEALNELSDTHIAEAAAKRKKPWRWAAPIAAALAVCVLLGALWQPRRPQTDIPTQTTASGIHKPPSPDKADPGPVIDPAVQLEFLVAEPQYPELCGYPLDHDSEAYSAWREDQRKLHNQPDGYADPLESFWAELLDSLPADGGNLACSPVNIYMALAMLAETTAGGSRQQILDVLGADTTQALRTQAQQVWKAHYNNDGLSTSILANSLWLKEGYRYNEATADLLAENYYASVFRGDLGSDTMNQVLQAWLSQQTGGLLGAQVRQAKLSPLSVLALASTVYYRVQWIDEFQEKNNTDGTFHTPKGDTTETFMNRNLPYGPYYWDQRFGAVSLSLEDGSQLWLILPDQGTAPEDLLKDGLVTDFLTGIKNEKQVRINLSVPKFDVCADMELSDSFKALGLTDIFDEGAADFTPIIPEADGGYVSQVQHAARVAIDEKGVTAAAFTVIDRCGAAPPPEEEIDFVLDRPFLFVIESRDGLPLFTGIVNEP